jgi:chloramphenicol 3-O phosphotransferase
MTRIIVLNGPGSAGKSSLARAIQRAAQDIWLHVQMDGFLDMLPEHRQDDAETFRYCAGPEGVRVSTGPAGGRLVSGLRRAVVALARAGNRVIFDTVMERDEAEACRQAFFPHRVLNVAVLAPLDVLEARERLRGDRMGGLARAQFGRVPGGAAHDLWLDMGAQSSDAGAQAVLAALARRAEAGADG